jgi:hypothetical protein
MKSYLGTRTKTIYKNLERLKLLASTKLKKENPEELNKQQKEK